MSTAPAFARMTRQSDLLLGWRASDLRIDPYTGQVSSGMLGIVGIGAVPGSISGKNNVTLPAGVAQPRWDQLPARGSVVRLMMEGEVGGQVTEQVTVPFTHRMMALSLFWRVYPLYTVGQNLATPFWGPMIGSLTTGGGWLGIRRDGVNWVAARRRGASEIISSLTDVGSVFPIDVLVTFSMAGTVQLSLRDATSTRVATAATDINYANVNEGWGNNQMTYNGVTGLVAPGGRWCHERIKIARGVQTFASMDLLS